MKNKGRRHKSGHGPWANGDCKGHNCGITRPIEQMSSHRIPKELKGKNLQYSKGSSKAMKKSWIKRIRGYFKSQTKLILE